jgi:hypothetical protein
VPLNTTTEEETNWLPVSIRERFAGSCENAIVVGDTELSMGTGRALPQSGFRLLHPGRSTSSVSKCPRRMVEDILLRRGRSPRIVPSILLAVDILRQLPNPGLTWFQFQRDRDSSNFSETRSPAYNIGRNIETFAGGPP